MDAQKLQQLRDDYYATSCRTDEAAQTRTDAKLAILADIALSLREITNALDGIYEDFPRGKR